MEKTETNSINSKKQNLYIFLSGLFLTNALIAEVVGTKIFSLETTFGFNPAQIKLPIWDSPLDFNLTAGVMLWPVVFIMTDIINEYYGKKGVRKISFLTAGFIAYSFFMIWVVTGLSPAAFWVEINNPLDINTAFNRIFFNGLGNLQEVKIFGYVRQVRHSFLNLLIVLSFFLLHFTFLEIQSGVLIKSFR